MFATAVSEQRDTAISSAMSPGGTSFVSASSAGVAGDFGGPAVPKIERAPALFLRRAPRARGRLRRCGYRRRAGLGPRHRAEHRDSRRDLLVDARRRDQNGRHRPGVAIGKHEVGGHHADDQNGPPLSCTSAERRDCRRIVPARTRTRARPRSASSRVNTGRASGGARSIGNTLVVTAPGTRDRNQLPDSAWPMFSARLRPIRPSAVLEPWQIRGIVIVSGICRVAPTRVSASRTSRSDSGHGSGRRARRTTTLKSVVITPIASAIVRIASRRSRAAGRATGAA